MTRYAKLVLALTSTVCVMSCRTTPGTGQPTPSSTEQPGERRLGERAEKYWRARVSEDWPTTYEFQDPAVREKSTAEEYTKWMTENEPFKIEKYDIRRWQTDGLCGWVEIDCRTSLRKFAAAPPRDLNRWEKWRFLAGDWYPVPAEQSEEYPEPPAKRDRAAEDNLRGRFAEFWHARQTGNIDALYELVDPPDREQIPKEIVAQSEAALKYLDCRVEWVEVIGRHGRVRVLYVLRVADPNMTKMPAYGAPATELWVLRDGVWYFDPKPAAE